MRQRLKGKLIVVFLSIFLAASIPIPVIFAEDSGTQIDNSSYVSILHSDRDGIKLQITIDDLVITEKTANNDLYHLISIPGSGYTTDIGYPQLPVIRLFIAIPLETESVTIESSKEVVEIMEGLNVYPVQQPIPEPYEPGSFIINEAGYNSDVFYPDNVYSSSIGWLRDYQFIHFEIFPISYNPVQQSLKIQNEIQFELTFHHSNKASETKTRDGFTEIYENTFINYNEAIEWYPYSPPIGMNNRNSGDLLDTSNQARLLIISHDNFDNHLQSFIDWKNNKGWMVFLTNTSQIYSQFPSSNNYESIKNFISYTYTDWTQSPSHVLLVGDVEFVPAFYYQGSTPTDHYYTCLMGGDYLPEIAIGRFSVKNTNELTQIIDKIVPYESDPYMNETAWYKKVMLVSDSGYFETTSDWVYAYLTARN